MAIVLERFVYQIVVVYFLLQICSAKTFPAFFIFGDSLVDVGNNFYLTGNQVMPLYPSGIDFGTGRHPSGRFTNNRTITDIIGQELGFKDFIPPYLAPTTVGDKILKGVNYASGGAGILNDTLEHAYGNVTQFDEQLSNFEKTREDIVSRIGIPAAKTLLRQSLYTVVFGANDVMGAHFLTTNFSQDAYLDILITRFRFQLTRLYKLGARKIVVWNTAALGCLPVTRDAYPPGDVCFAPVNKLAQLYNSKLKKMLTEITAHLSGSIYVYTDLYAMLEDIIQNYRSYGFENADSACCHIAGRHGAMLKCLPFSRVCPDRTKYVFWDQFHPTDAGYMLAAKHVLDGGLNYMSPMNVRQLANV